MELCFYCLFAFAFIVGNHPIIPRSIQRCNRDFQEFENEVIKKEYLPHIRHRGEQSITKGSIHHTTRRRWVA
ncbi:MAG: hypothetical protein WBQ25_04935, partial [Nitrososphaeraceae archaeon]